MKLMKLATVMLLLAPLFSFGAETPYQDDAPLAAQIASLRSGDSLLLPAVKVEGNLTIYEMDKRGPANRDYCNKMAYAPERQTALYAGGNHASPHRMNDVWEYHLGSNSWHLLYAPDGGNAGKHKGAYFLTSRTLVKKPDTPLDDKQKASIEAYREWWTENVALRDGHLATKKGGPIMPAHTWDAFCYDAAAGRLLWGMGANPAAQVSTHAYFTGRSVAEIEKEIDPNNTPMWMFDPVRKRWLHYRIAGKRAALRGMGATMVYLSDRKESLWYVAAQNVSPHAFEMWMFDAVGDKWTELRPNDGKSISELALKEKAAPMSEQQCAYSPKHEAVVAVHHHDTFVYEVAGNRWSMVVTDERIYGHDARSVFAYDPRSDQFLLAFPPDGRGKEMRLAAFSLETKRWKMIEPRGDRIPATKYGSYMGYFDSHHGVFVVQGRTSNRMWIFRP